MRARPGQPAPLGAIWDGHGVNFALFSAHATRVDLCLFDSRESHVESHRVRMSERTDQVWHCYLPDARPGQLYGYRVDGPYDPPNGHRFNATKLLFDPYTTQVGRAPGWHDALCDEPRRGEGRGGPDRRDTARWAPLSMVTDREFDWGGDQPPLTRWADTVIYELNVKGFTWRHPDIPDPLRGTYLGLASEPVLRHLRALGVTAVELLPVHQHVSEQALLDRGMVNYWGYNSLGFLAPDVRYATAPETSVREFKTMVRQCHAAGLEVILDVVYNHTAEGGSHGPTLSWRGLDNATYYRLQPDNLAAYHDVTGCGNTLDVREPRVLQLVMDSLRYWVQEMHVDGFRFDLASTLARGRSGVDMRGGFFAMIRQDPALSAVKLIAEPWDLGHDGYQVGRFPAPFREWNDKYRDTARRFWRGDEGQAKELATRLAGSSDLYASGGRRPTASVNFLTAHDGFTLADLVSYSHKHNEANGEDNRDGGDDTGSWNCGAEGPTDDPEVTALRARMRRSLLATLVVSQGVPMLSAGDEMGRSQGGNNNAYCQDNETSWVDWGRTPDVERFLTFVRELMAFRMAHPTLRRRRFLRGGGLGHGRRRDLAWLDPTGGEMTDEAWHSPFVRCLGMRLDGDAVDEVNDEGQPLRDDTVLVLFNAAREPVDFSLPDAGSAGSWHLVFDTADETVGRRDVIGRYRLRDHTVAILFAGGQR